MDAGHVTIFRQRCTALIAVLALSAVHASAQPARFSIAGEGQQAVDAPAQSNDRFALKAQLAGPVDASTALSTQAGDRFSLTALLSTSSLVCYNDTIFRDGFDGTGF
jgi:hypothetical protein